MTTDHSLRRNAAFSVRLVLGMLTCVVAPFWLGCADSTEPGGIAGSYTATTFTETRTGQAPINILAAGGSLSIVIAADSSTSGTLSVPASVTGSEALVASMAGLAVQKADTVWFQQDANSFVRKSPWLVVGPNSLRYDRTIDGSTLVVVLSR